MTKVPRWMRSSMRNEYQRFILKKTIETGNKDYVNMALSGGGGDANRGQTLNAQTFVDVTNTSNVKVRFLTNGATYINWFGDANATYTYATFVLLGDT